jgi:hypothetical protein
MLMPINIYNQTWLSWAKWVSKKGATGMTVWPYIWYGLSAGEVSPSLRKHEEYHWHHQKRWLVLPWFVVYWLVILKTGYWDHPWEVLARNAEGEQDESTP